MADERLSNVIGAPFAEHVLTQLDIRAFHNSTGKGSFPKRNNTEVLFLANKSGWAKLTSSVKLIAKPDQDLTKFYTEQLKLSSGYSGERDLAKNWILQSGTSIANGSGINLRSGLGPEGSYGFAGTEELGYRPMPGLISIQVDTKGILGSLREATINFKVWNMNQLNVIEALYFRLGYSMLLEWGHNQFYVNRGSGFGTFETNVGGIDSFQDKRKEQIQQEIAKLSKQYSGNYEGMLGIVTNYTWSFNQEGGYDCTLKLIGLGAIIDSLRINLSFKMPDAVFQNYTLQQKTIQQLQEEADALNRKRKEDLERGVQGLPPLPDTPINAQQIYSKIYITDIGNPNPLVSEQDFLTNHSFYTAYNVNEDSVNNVYDYFYKATKGGIPTNLPFANELNQKRTGLFLSPITNQRSNWQVLFCDTPPPITISPGALNLVAIRNLNSKYDPSKELTLSSPFSTGVFTSGDLTTALGSDEFIKLFDLTIRDGVGVAFSQRIRSVVEGSTQVLENDKVYPIQSNINPLPSVLQDIFGAPYSGAITMSLSYKALVRGVAGNNLQKTFSVILSYIPPPLLNLEDPSEQLRPTRREIINALQTWFRNSGKINVTQVQSTINTSNGQRDVIITGNLLDLNIPNKTSPNIEIKFNNTGLIQTVLPPPLPPSETTPQQTQAPNTGDNSGQINEATSAQTDPSQRFASALHAMLTAVKSQMLSKTRLLNDNEVAFSDSLVDLTNKLYEGTIFDGIINQSSLAQALATVGQSTNPNGVPFDLIRYALKGFNSNLMSNQELFDKIPTVNFKDLCTAYGVRYVMENEVVSLNFPIYIKLGYLLSFINSMCLIYDSTVDTNKRPYVYLDFNPETNFCLTNPQHLSVDPYVCMIPFEGNQDAFLSLFPKDITTALKKNPSGVFGDKQSNRLSSFLNPFKNPKNAYQGKTMEILLNVNFLLEVLNQNTTNDPQHSVNLKGFLDAIVSGINKSIGNINLFRVSYRDDTNTVVIKDDQFVPPYDGESYMLYLKTYLENGPKGKPKYGMIPVFGAQSLVREMEFKTNLTTKISNQIAISAQAFTGSANSTDYSPFSYLNIAQVNFVDSFKPRVSDSADTTKVQTAAVTGSDANDLSLAEQFNTHILSIYRGGEYVSQKRISTATNYYIDSMAKVKSNDPITVAAPFIPANLSITIDGISGIVMGNAFTIPEDRLPISLRGSNDQTKVGFVVVGLTHTVDNNQWLTKIRGQMIRLRDVTSYSGAITNERTTQLLLPVTPAQITTNTPWSAAFISFVMQRAEVPFPFNAAHTGYAQSLRINNQGFQTLNPADTVIQLGDIVIRNRNGNTLTYYSNPWSGESHGDVIVQISGGTAFGIGGNVSNTVFRSSISLTQGRLAERDYFVIVRPPVNFVNTIVNVAEVEYKLWNSNKWTETTASAANTLRAYYKTVGIIV